MAVALQERDLDKGMLADGYEEHAIEDVSEELVPEDIDKEYLDQFLWDAAVYAQVCIDKFFEGKEMYGGGPIPHRLLSAPRYLSLVLNADMDAIPYAYAAMKKAGHPTTQKVSKLATVPRDVKLIISILNHCYILGVPQKFVYGMMLMYLEICEGVSIID